VYPENVIKSIVELVIVKYSIVNIVIDSKISITQYKEKWFLLYYGTINNKKTFIDW